MTILIVDDEVDTHLLYKLKFKKLVSTFSDVKLQFFLSAEECLMYLDDKLGETHMILTDINMPGMDGFELLRNVKEMNSLIPVYMVSAYESSEFRKKAVDMGASGFISKPVDFNQLVDVIQQMHTLK